MNHLISRPLQNMEFMVDFCRPNSSIARLVHEPDH